MPILKKHTTLIQLWLSKDWVQWTVATILLLLFSWLFMGNAINNCSTTSTALGSDSTGGMVWNQWAGGNDLSWEGTNKSNYPFGENPSRPLSITATLFVVVYKLFATLTTPICGMNLMVMLGYMSTGLLMFGLVKWLLSRFDIALFASFAAAFVPYHTLKAQSHVSYIYGSLFVAIIWAYLWFLSRPSYKRAAVLAFACAPGYYFDGYYILISTVVIVSLLVPSFLYDAYIVLFNRRNTRKVLLSARNRLKYLLLTATLLALMLLPILVVYINYGQSIEQNLAAVRSNVRVETLTYGTRPIEFVLPSYNSALMPDGYANWRNTKSHNSNFSEVNQYMGFTVILLATYAVFALIYQTHRKKLIQNIRYPHVVFVLVLAFSACFMLSLPASAYIFGHDVNTPVEYLTRLTANWRVLSRFFLAMDPLVIILASLGLYLLTKNLSRRTQILIVLICGTVLFLEYLPSPLRSTGDLYKNTPLVYKQLRNDASAKLVAEYPLADFTYSPEIFTFQPVHNKTLLNANDGSISRGPFDSSIAGLNDSQTLGALKQMNVDVLITHGFVPNNTGLSKRYVLKEDSKTRQTPTSAYTINSLVNPRPHILSIQKGYESLFVDHKQISHRAITQQGTMRVLDLNKVAPVSQYDVNFNVNSLCPVNANLKVMQDGRILWSGSAGNRPIPIRVVVTGKDFYISTADCSIDVTEMSAEAI